MSPEIELLLCCTRPAADEARVAELAEAANWNTLLGLVRRHGVTPLVAQRLSPVAPPAAREELRACAEGAAKQNLVFTGVLLQILSELEKHAIAAVPYKGPVLAQELYGNPGLREFCDLDLLVRRDDALHATAVLRGLGYRPAFELTPAQERAHLRSGCEIALHDGRVPLEVHWEIAPRPFALSLGENFWGRLRKVQISGCEVRSLGLEDLMIVLAIHGGKHVWSRLAWVCDVAALSRQPLDWAQVEREAQRVGALRLVQLAMAVAHDLLGTELPLRVDREARALAATVRQNLASADPEEEAAARHRFLLRARERWGDRARYLWRHAVTPGQADWDAARLPAPLYPVVRIARLVKKFARL